MPFKTQQEEGDPTIRFGRILEIAPASVFRARGVKLSDAGKHCKIESEGRIFYRRINRVIKVLIEQLKGAHAN